MDTRGIFDAMTRNVSSLHGLRSSRAGYELTLGVQQALKIKTGFRWVNGLAMLADCLTKFSDFCSFWPKDRNGELYMIRSSQQKKLRKRELEQATRQMEQLFVDSVQEMAYASRWPWNDQQNELRSMMDEKLRNPFSTVEPC